MRMFTLWIMYFFRTLAQASDSDIKPEFLEAARAFTNHILSDKNTYKLETNNVTGQRNLKTNNVTGQRKLGLTTSPGNVRWD